MIDLLAELKTSARLRLNVVRRQDVADRSEALRLKDCLNHVARDAGFTHWDHARRVLGGQAVPGDDMGRFWHAPGCNRMLNQWFANETQARAAHAADPGAFLLPYGRQFILAQDDFVRELGLDPADPAWTTIHRDLVRGYGTTGWEALAWQRLVAQRGTSPPQRL